MTRLAILLCVALSACSDEATTPLGGPAEPAVCPEGMEAAAWTAPLQVAVTGPSVNALHVVEDEILMVVSQDNTIIAYDLTTRAVRRFADLGNDRGPYDLAWNDTHIFVTNFVSESVSVLDRSGKIVAELTDGFDGPSGVAVGEGVVYVSNVAYISPTQGYGDGYVVVIDAAEFTTLGTIPTAHKNPQFLRYDDGALFVSDTGALDFVDGRAVATSSGAIERWTPTANPLQPTIDVAELPVTSPVVGASPGRPVLLGSTAYVASATAPHTRSALPCRATQAGATCGAARDCARSWRRPHGVRAQYGAALLCRPRCAARLIAHTVGVRAPLAGAVSVIAAVCGAVRHAPCVVHAPQRRGAGLAAPH